MMLTTQHSLKLQGVALILSALVGISAIGPMVARADDTTPPDQSTWAQNHPRAAQYFQNHPEAAQRFQDRRSDRGQDRSSDRFQNRGQERSADVRQDRRQDRRADMRQDRRQDRRVGMRQDRRQDRRQYNKWAGNHQQWVANHPGANNFAERHPERAEQFRDRREARR